MRQPYYFPGRNIAEIEVVLIDIGNPFLVWRGFFKLSRNWLRPLLALIVFELAGPGRPINLKRDRLLVFCVVKRVERKLCWQNLALRRFCKRNRQSFVIKCGAKGVLRGINKEKFGPRSEERRVGKECR